MQSYIDEYLATFPKDSNAYKRNKSVLNTVRKAEVQYDTAIQHWNMQQSQDFLSDISTVARTNARIKCNLTLKYLEWLSTNQKDSSFTNECYFTHPFKIAVLKNSPANNRNEYQRDVGVVSDETFRRTFLFGPSDFYSYVNTLFPAADDGTILHASKRAILALCWVGLDLSEITHVKVEQYHKATADSCPYITLVRNGKPFRLEIQDDFCAAAIEYSIASDWDAIQIFNSKNLRFIRQQYYCEQDEPYIIRGRRKNEINKNRDEMDILWSLHHFGRTVESQQLKLPDDSPYKHQKTTLYDVFLSGKFYRLHQQELNAGLSISAVFENLDPKDYSHSTYVRWCQIVDQKSGV